MRPPSSPEGRQFFMSPDTEFARLCAGGNRIRTIGPAEKEMAVEKGPAADIVVSRDHLCLMTPSSLSLRHLSSATAERPFHKSGTNGSNPVPSSGESGELPYAHLVARSTSSTTPRWQ